ncbi:CADM3 protein, partial [Emberiza fucata]|nr:CADM3 protein [Emberiza fucata]
GTEVVEDPNGKTFTVTSRVEFRVTKEDNEVEVTCTVDHESLQNSERSTTQKLQVHCTWGDVWGGVEVQGTPHRPGFVPSPQEFLWEKEGSDAPLQLSSDSVLIFPFLNKSDSGTYVCTATSSMGSVVAKYNLDVSGECGPGGTRALPPGGPESVTLSPVHGGHCLLCAQNVSLCHLWVSALHPVCPKCVTVSLEDQCTASHPLSPPAGTYLTHEAKGSDDAPDADTAIINAEGGQAGGDDKKEYFI